MAAKSAKKPAKSDITGSVRVAVIYGSDSYQRQEVFTQLRDALAKAHGEVEVFQFDGNQATLADVMDELRGYSLMQQYKIVTVDAADVFAKNYRAVLERYAAEPVEHATLVLRSERWNSGNLDKAIVNVGFVAKCEPLARSEVARWLISQATKEFAVSLPAAVADAMVERLGSDQARLQTELAKLAVMVGKDGEVTSELVEQHVGQSSDAQAWAIRESLLGAIANRSCEQAISMVHELVELAGQHETQVSYNVAELMRQFCLAVLWRHQNVGQEEIGRRLKLFPRDRQRLFFEALQRIDGKAVAGLFDRIIELDRRNKSGLGDPVRSMETFTVNLMASVR